MAKVTGGELLVRTLMRAGVEQMFGLHGAHVESIFQSCLGHGIPILDVRHEVAGGHAAEGYARTTRKLGVAIATAGPGFTNVVTSIANAYLDRTPVLYLAGAAGLAQAETNTLQAGIDQVAIVTPITKWAHRVSVTADIPRLVAEAVRLATTGPTGPVFLDLPSDVLNATVDEESVTIPERILIDDAPAPAAAAVDKALELLMQAERPVIMAGVEAWRGDAGAALKAFVERTNIPVFSDFPAHGLLPSSHPAYGGTTHKMSELTAETGRPDVILALGIRFGLFTMQMSDRLVPHAAKIIHVDIAPREIGLIRQVAVPVVADPRETLLALDARLPGRTLPDWSGWLATVRSARAGRRARLAAQFEEAAPSPIHPFQAVAAIAEALPKDAIVIGDGAEAYHWLNETIALETPGSYITHGFLGAVGMGLGLALGAQTAHPDRPVLCLVGDGAVGFTLAEFDTMARHNLPIVTVVMNNRSWAASQHFQEIVSGANRVTGTELHDTNYHDVARALGAEGVRVTQVGELKPAIEAAFRSRRPTCINVTLDLKPIPPELFLLMER